MPSLPPFRLCGAGLATLLVLSLGAAEPVPARGPLRLHPTNPRYFTDGTTGPDGTPRAVYLAGSHVWQNLQDSGHRLESGEDPPPVFDYAAFLDLLQASGHNATRLWRWELPRWTERDTESKKTEYSQPHPWARPGPELARDGKPRFDLSRFDDDYFNRLRTRVRLAGVRGIYVTVMLFEFWGVTHAPDAWQFHPFAAPNNVNGIEADANGDGRGVELHLLRDDAVGRRILLLQEAYVRRVLETLNDCDNVLYEVGNEGGTYTQPWQEHVVAFIRRVEAGLPRQHLTGISWMFHRDENRVAHGNNAALLRSNADWIAPGNDRQLSFDRPPFIEYPGKLIVTDTDHMGWRNPRQQGWFWQQFCRGYHTLYLEWSYAVPAVGAAARQGMGQTVAWARRVNLAAMLPSPNLASTTYCLADPGREYLIFQPAMGAFTVTLPENGSTFAAEWFSPVTGQRHAGEDVRAGGVQTVTPPQPGMAVLHLRARR